jgi:hypothetical protein
MGGMEPPILVSKNFHIIDFMLSISGTIIVLNIG